MQTFIKFVLTAALVVAIAWPMAFWGDAVSKDVKQLIRAQFTVVPQTHIAW